MTASPAANASLPRSNAGAIIGMLFWFGTLIIIGLFIVAVTYIIVGC